MFVAGRKRKLAPESRDTADSRKQAANEAPSTRPVSNTRTAQPFSSVSTSDAEINKWHALGVENFRERQYRSALDYHNRAIALAGNTGAKNAKLFEARSHTLYKLREFSRALEDAKEALRTSAGSAAGYTLMASILSASGRHGDALAAVKQGLRQSDPQTADYEYLQVLNSSLTMRFDPAYVPMATHSVDPVERLPEDIVILILRLLDTRALCICRQLPAYAKAQKWAQHVFSRAPSDATLRLVFEKSQRSLVAVSVPSGSSLSAKALESLFACPRPRLARISIDRLAALRPEYISRILHWSLPAMVSEIRLPYCAQLGNDEMGIIAKLGLRVRVLDISGCDRVGIKRLFMAWSLVLVDAHAATQIEELYINDHPGIAEFLVYSSKHLHFSKLRVLHAAIRDQLVYSKLSSLGPLLIYFRRMQVTRAPFPDLQELNIDGVWDATLSSHRFESSQLCELLWQCRLFSCNLRRVSALNSPVVSSDQLHHLLQHNLSSLRHLHLTRATNLDTRVLLARTVGISMLAGSLPLVSLDLSGCVGVTPQGLSTLVACCRSLQFVNFSQTAADNSVLGRLTEIVGAPDSTGIEVLILDTTDVTGAAIRDFAAACIRRYRHLRGNQHVSRAWRLQLLDVDNCVNVGSDAVALVRDLLSSMSTRVLAAI
ncbi:hypothetical protein EV174_003991 [Coemansia sp. RSA 2320]|nr:hypothetical protein EV174_003991 [Coemansia sp. RSA 2320]